MGVTIGIHCTIGIKYHGPREAFVLYHPTSQGYKRIGSVVAICGGIGLILNPVTTKEMEHLICAFIVFLSSYFWYPECTVFQLKTFCISTLFFFGGFALDIIFAVFHLNKITNEKNSSSIIMSSFLPFLPSIICMLGEFGIFITWGIMVQNEDVTKKKN